MTPGLIFVGAVVIAGMLLCRKIMQSGTTTLAQARDKYRARILDGEKQLQNDANDITFDEQAHLLRVALEDLLRLEDSRTNFRLREDGKAAFILESPQSTMRVSFAMREQKLRATQKILHGHERWTLTANGVDEEFASIATLMTRINEHLHGDICDLPPEMAHIARRFRHLRRN